MKKIVQGVTIECVKGNIANQLDCDTVVNAANAQLRMGGGVAGAIHRTAGPELEKECIPLGPIKPGEAVITGAYNLPNKHVIHCLGPVYGRDKPERELLSSCYKNALKLADENKLESIAFCAISCGIFGYPLKEGAEAALGAVIKKIPELKNVKLIRFVLFGDKACEVFSKILEEKGSHLFF
ncbi:MAG: macro domain-containing protein [Candidatus Omnitrophota bacterium]